MQDRFAVNCIYISCVCCIQDAPHLPINGSLKDILKATAGACLQYAVIEGNGYRADGL